MVQPANYNIDVQSPFQAFGQGAQLGTGLAELDARRQAAQQDAVRQENLNKELELLNANPNPTSADLKRVAFLLPPAQLKGILDVFQAGTKEQQDNQLKVAGEIYSAFASGQPKIGIDLLNYEATAAENSGNRQQARAFRTYAKLAEGNPSRAQKTIGIMLTPLPGGDKVIDAAIKAQTAPATISKAEADAAGAQIETANKPLQLNLGNLKTQAEINNIVSTIEDRSKRLNLDRDTLTSNVEAKLLEFGQKGANLDPSATNIVNNSVVASIGLEQAAGKTLDLANQIEQKAGTSGITAKLSETLKSITGNQDAMTQLRNEYTRIRNSAAIKSLPPGVATDKDIELALKGIPPETANASTISSFLRGMSKMQQYEAATESAKSEWVSSTGNLGRSKSDIEIGGIRVPKGTTFPEFARQFMDQRAKDLAVTQANTAVGGRSYMRYANPQAGQ